MPYGVEVETTINSLLFVNGSEFLHVCIRPFLQQTKLTSELERIKQGRNLQSWKNIFLGGQWKGVAEWRK